MQWEPIREAFFWEARFWCLSVWKSGGLWNGIFKSELLWFLPVALWNQAETRSHQNSYVLHPYFWHFLGGWGEKDVWRVSTSTGVRRTRRLSSGVDTVTSSTYSVKEHELPGKSSTIVSTSTNVSSWQGLNSDNSQVSQLESISI